MRKLAANVAFPILSAGLLAIAAYAMRADGIAAVEPGMSEADVVKVMGDPVARRPYQGDEWQEFRGREFIGIGWADRSYFVVVKDGRVVSYGTEEQ